MSILSSTEHENLNMILSPACTSVVNLGPHMKKMLHEEIEIKCFYEGKTTLLVGSERITASAGDVVVINPYEFHATIGQAEEQQGRYHLLMIPLDYFSGMGIGELELRSVLLANRKAFKNHFPKDEHLFGILNKIFAEYEAKENAYRAVIKGLVTELFASILRYGLVSSTAETDESDILHSYELVEPALQYIRNNYSDTITMDKLVSLCSISKWYFCRVFKAVTKKAAMEYLRDYRIDIADIMLANTNKSIAQVAESCGFEDVNYFSRCYKARYGISPGKRKTMRREL